MSAARLQWQHQFNHSVLSYCMQLSVQKLTATVSKSHKTASELNTIAQGRVHSHWLIHDAVWVCVTRSLICWQLQQCKVVCVFSLVDMRCLICWQSFSLENFNEFGQFVNVGVAASQTSEGCWVRGLDCGVRKHRATPKHKALGCGPHRQ